MKSFGEWFNDSSAVVKTIEREKDIPEELIDGGIEDSKGGWEYPCRSCGEYCDIFCEPSEFNPEYHYCGKNQHCCP